MTDITLKNAYNKLLITAAATILALLMIIVWMHNDFKGQMVKLNTDFKTERQKDGSLIATQQQNLLSRQQALDAGLLRVESYMKNIQSQVSIGVNTVVREKLVPYEIKVEKIVYVDSSTNDTSIYVKVPLPVKWSDSFNFFSGVVRADGFELDSFGSINNLQITVFDKKHGFLKKRIPVVEVKSNNPNSKITGLQNVIIKTKTPFYKKVLPVFTAGAAVATYIILKLK